MAAQTEQREADQLEGVPPPEQALGLVGHQQTFGRLEHLLAADQLPGGILLSGPRGIGKATLAYQLARRILTTTGDEPAERVAEQVRAGVHPNLFTLRRRLRDDQKAFYTVIRVEDVRGLISRMHQTRGRAGHRVCIVDAIDDCNASSANALLKTLEEPPCETHFILVSHRPGQLLPTIRSRCQAHALRPLPDEEVRAVATPFAGDAALIDAAIGLAGGRPRRAIEALSVADNAALSGLRDWLLSPNGAPDSVPLNLADGLSGPQKAREFGFARDRLLDWIAAEARAAAAARQPDRLASANALWEKANALFSDSEIYNLDQRQTLMAILDAIRAHDRLEPDRIRA